MPDRCTDPTCEQHWPARYPTRLENWPVESRMTADELAAAQERINQFPPPPDVWNAR